MACTLRGPGTTKVPPKGMLPVRTRWRCSSPFVERFAHGDVLKLSLHQSAGARRVGAHRAPGSDVRARRQRRRPPRRYASGNRPRWSTRSTVSSANEHLRATQAMNGHPKYVRRSRKPLRRSRRRTARPSGAAMSLEAFGGVGDNASALRIGDPGCSRGRSGRRGYSSPVAASLAPSRHRQPRRSGTVR